MAFPLPEDGQETRVQKSENDVEHKDRECEDPESPQHRPTTPSLQLDCGIDEFFEQFVSIKRGSWEKVHDTKA